MSVLFTGHMMMRHCFPISVLVVGLLLICGCQSKPTQKPDSPTTAASSREKSEALQEAAANALRDHVGDFQLAAWPQITPLSIPDLIASSASNAGDQETGPELKFSRRNESNEAWVFERAGELIREIEIGIPIQMTESQMTIQVGARKNMVLRGQLESVDLAEFDVVGFWYPAPGTQWLQICCQTKVIQIATLEDDSGELWTVPDRKQLATQVALRLLESARNKMKKE